MAKKKVEKKKTVKLVEKQQDNVETSAVSKAIKAVGELSWDEKNEFNKRFSELFGQQRDLQGQGKEFEKENWF